MSQENKEEQKSFKKFNGPYKKPHVAYSKEGKKSNNNARLNQGQIQDMLFRLRQLESRYPVIKEGGKKALQTLNDNGGFKDDIYDIINSHRGKGKLAAIEQAVGEKYMDSLDSNFKGNFYPPPVKIAMLSSVYADSLGSILGIAGKAVAPWLNDMVAEKGPKFLAWLMEKAIPRFVSGEGSGTGLVRRLTTLPGRVSAETVWLPYLAAVICPEKYKSLTPDNGFQALAYGFQEQALSVITGTDGNAITYCIFDAMTSAGTSGDWQIEASTAATTSNTATGVIATPYYGAGAFNAVGSTSVTKFRATVAAFRFVPELSSNNNSGTFSLAYFTDAPVSSMGTAGSSVPYNVILQAPFFHSANVAGTDEWRQIHVPHGGETVVVPFATTSTTIGGGVCDFVQLLGTGLPAATTVGTLYLATGIDYQPGTASSSLITVDQTPAAPASISCITSLIKKCPQIAQLKLDDALDLAAFIMDLPFNTMSDVIDAVCNYAQKHKARPRNAFKSAMGGKGAGSMSFDMDV